MHHNSDADIASLSAAHNRVDPSTSVNRNVTVPEGRARDIPSRCSVMSAIVTGLRRIGHGHHSAVIGSATIRSSSR